ncbi:hypothetical protein [Streptomyces kronopolitis]
MSDPGTAKPSQRKSAKPKKKAPSHFKPGGASLVQNLLAGADDVAGRSFLGGGNLGGDSDAETASTTADAQATSHSPSTSSSSNASTTTPKSQHDGADHAAAATRPVAAPSVPTAMATGEQTTKGARTAAKSAAQQKVAPSAPAVAAEDTSSLPRQGRTKALTSPPSTAAPSSAESGLRDGVSGDRPQSAAPRADTAEEAESSDVQQSAPSQPVSRPLLSAGRRGRGARWAHEAVHESFADAKIRSSQWKSHGFRIEPETLDRLKERLKTDRRTSGNVMLGQSHYLDAALRSMPQEVDTQIAMADDFLDDRMGIVAPGKQSTYRVGINAYAFISTLNQVLQEADYGRRGLYIVSAALERLLDDLDTEGELPPPARRKRGGTDTRS